MTLSRQITVQTGARLRCKGWRQESILRLLENNLVNAERPEDLVVYGGGSKAARDWESLDKIVRSLHCLETCETLVIQSGKPIGIFETGENAPLVIMSNGTTITATQEEIANLRRRNLTIHPGMTAAAWQYIGSQGIIQGTYETFMAAARRFFGGSLVGRTILTAGSGGMGGAQPLAGVLAGAAILVADVRLDRLARRAREGYLERLAPTVPEAVRLWMLAARERRAASIGVAANIVDVLEHFERHSIVPNIATDQTTPDPLLGYVPAGISGEECDRLAWTDPGKLIDLAGATLARHVQGLLALMRKGTVVFEYGNGLRERALANGVANAFDIPGFVDLFIRPMFCEGIGPFRFIAIEGHPDTIFRIDEALMEMFRDVPRITEWLTKASRVKFTGLPARVCWLGHGERTEAALAVNDLIEKGDIAGPVALTRDHLDSGSVTCRFRETENMRDGSDCIADWPILNGLLDAIAGADLVAIHEAYGRSLNAGPTVIADGTAHARERIRRVMHADTGLGVLRHADAGYETAIAARNRHQLGLDVRLARHDDTPTTPQ
ncbi:MAG TPA: urocanate hydratase [bacterium]|nr:urocanate hydratase [bacterium]